MPSNFIPNYAITPRIAKALMRIEAAKEKVANLPLTPTVLASLRQTAELMTTHYSTMIEGNRLTLNEVRQAIEHNSHFPGRERDEQEVKGYYAALEQLEQYAAKKSPVTEKIIQTFHALAMNGGRSRVKPTPYRDGQNVIRDSSSGEIVYTERDSKHGFDNVRFSFLHPSKQAISMGDGEDVKNGDLMQSKPCFESRLIYMPPEAKDVPSMMKNLILWIKENPNLPCPIIAAVAHYQFATIHPYYDGNGRTARLLTTLILHLGGYGLKGLYSLEEYYTKNLLAYYRAISKGPSHNYYLGRAEADITDWVDYFCEGMAHSFENVIKQMTTAHSQENSPLLKTLDPKQRKALELFQNNTIITSQQIGKLFGFKPRSSSHLCKQWVKEGFLEIVNPSNKARTYRLSSKYSSLL